MRADDLEALLEAPLKRLDPRHSGPLTPAQDNIIVGGGKRDNERADTIRNNVEYFADGHSVNGEERRDGRDGGRDDRHYIRGSRHEHRRHYDDRYGSNSSRDDRDRTRHYRRSRSRSPSRSRSRTRHQGTVPSRPRNHSYSRSPVRPAVPVAAPQTQPPTLSKSSSSSSADKRTVFVRQIGQRATDRDVKEVCESQIGPVVAVKLVLDRITKRHKGVAYVEFVDESSVPKALAMTGYRLMGVPLVFELTEAEKNRIAAEQAMNSATSANTITSHGHTTHHNNEMTAVLVEPVAPHCTAHDLMSFFSGARRVMVIGETAAVVDYQSSGEAQRAVSALDRHILCNRQVRLRVVDRHHHVAPRPTDGVGGKSGNNINNGDDGEDEDYLTPQQRAELMLKLARSRAH